MFLAAAVAVFGSGAGALGASLEKELRGLLNEHPKIRAGEKAVGSSRLEIEKVRAQYYPTVRVTSDVTYQRIDNPITRSKKRDWSRTRQVAGVTISQNLYNGYSTTSSMKAAQLNRSIANITLEGTRQNTMFEGTVAYINVLRQKRLLKLSRNNEANIQLQLNLEDARVQRGSGIAVDVLQAKSRLQLSRERRVTFEGQLEDAITVYTQTFNHAPDLDAMVDPAPPIKNIPSDLKTTIRVAQRKNPAIATSNVSIDVARESQRQAKSEYHPQVDAEAAWNFEKHYNNILGIRRDYSVSLQATWDIFTGFSTQAAMAQAAYDYGISRDTLDLTTRQVIEQARIAWQALITARERVKLLENAVNIAGEVFDSRKRLREAGKETVINVLDAESEVNSAQINYTTAAYDELTAVYQLMLAMGQLGVGYMDTHGD